jgi:hypothetical protein
MTVSLIESYVLGSTFQMPSNGLSAAQRKTGSSRMDRIGLLMFVLLLFEYCDVECPLLEFDSYGILAIRMTDRLAEYEETLNVYSPCNCNEKHLASWD